MKTHELIPLKDITEDARNIAVAWIEGYEPMGFDIQQKHKLASDIMNYASEQVFVERERIIDHIVDQIEAYPMFPEEKQSWITYIKSLKA